jgi:hypothetical protein
LWFRGVMAQDVATICPEAVRTCQKGVLKVNYDLIDVPMVCLS